MTDLADEYAPGWADDAVAMMARRSAASRAGWFLPVLAPGMRVLDVGCGPGTITLGLAQAVGPTGACTGLDVQPSQVELARDAARDAGVVNASFEVASAYALPFADGSFDAVFSHALFEHLVDQAAVAAELRRVLRAGGVAGVCCSDWSGVHVDPRTEDVEHALRWHLALRRRAGGDPFAGVGLAALIESAGFVDLCVEIRHEVDMSYGDFGRYVGARIEAAAAAATGAERAALLAGAEAARRWAQHDGGRLSQPWTAVLARNP